MEQGYVYGVYEDTENQRAAHEVTGNQRATACSRANMKCSLKWEFVFLTTVAGFSALLSITAVVISTVLRNLTANGAIYLANNDTLEKLELLEKRIESLEYYHKNVTAIECETGYIRNPFFNTCVRLVQSKLTWDDAKDYCEESGETLATFETLESAFWLIGQRKTNKAWEDDHAWIGGRRVDNRWEWTGRSTELVNSLPWAAGQPTLQSGQNCAGSFVDSNYLFQDFFCTDKRPFFCEKAH